MAQRPAKKPDKQLDLPTPAPLITTRILPMELRMGDRLTDETGEWEVVGKPYTTNAGKSARVLLQRVGYPPNVAELWRRSAHEHLTVKRATAEEGKR